MKKSGDTLAAIYTLFRCHARLFHYELEREKQVAWRRLRAIGVGVMCLLACVTFGQILLFTALLQTGISLLVAATFMTAANGLAGYVLIKVMGRRPLNEGIAFEMSREEYSRTKQWIENRISKNGELSALK